MITAKEFAKCKRGVRVVNCARGGLINENDLGGSYQGRHRCQRRYRRTGRRTETDLAADRSAGMCLNASSWC